jgi:alpha-beta hydrolase superfamily lysophospholipase
LRVALGISAALALFSCASINPRSDPGAAYRAALGNVVPPLSVEAAAPEAGLLADYAAAFIARYGLEPPPDQYLGYLPSGDYRIFTHLLVPPPGAPPARGTVFVFHGFASDSSRYGALAAALLREGWAVVLADLPGHGLSTGTPGDAPDFGIYGRMVRDLTAALDPYLPRPFAAIGHSTGALAVLDYSLRYEQTFVRCAFFAPLVRTAWWPVLRGARSLTRPWIHSLKTTSYTALGVRRFPLRWFDALVAWERRVRRAERLNLPPTLVLLADRDGVVAGGYNAAFIQERSLRAVVRRVDGTDHYELDSRNPAPEVLSQLVAWVGD